MSIEKIFIIGGTGNIGSVAVRGLLEKNIPVTLYTRDSKKTKALFNNHNLVDTLEDDFNTLRYEGTDKELQKQSKEQSERLEKALISHTRLFLLISGSDSMCKLKKHIATYAYAAGVKQIVDISSMWVSMPWRSTTIGNIHLDAEQAMVGISGRGNLVTLRPGRFMSNIVMFDRPTIANGVIYDTMYPETKVGWISPNDIGNVAAVVLSDPIEKHGDGVYELNSDIATSTERAEILSEVLGKKIRYEKVGSVDKYDQLMSHKMPHLIAVDLSTDLTSFNNLLPRVGGAVNILLRRNPETLRQYFEANKSLLS